MGWTYQIDIVAASCLQGEHHPGQCLGVYGATLTQLADGVVLAEDTFQVTVGEEYGPRAVPAYQRRLFTKVRSIAGNDNLARDLAFSALTSRAIDPALARAQAAFFETGFSFLNSSL